jgi:hypothetical protein
MPDDLYAAVIGGVVLVAVVGTLLGWCRDTVWLRTTATEPGQCPVCRHPEHWPWCRRCGCDLFTEPAE